MATMENSAILQLQNVGFDIGGQTILNAVNLGIAPGEFKLIKTLETTISDGSKTYNTINPCN